MNKNDKKKLQNWPNNHTVTYHELNRVFFSSISFCTVNDLVCFFIPIEWEKALKRIKKRYSEEDFNKENTSETN